MKILGVRENEKMALINYDGDEDVEWVYDMDVDVEDFVEPELYPIQPCYSIDEITTPLWEEA